MAIRTVNNTATYSVAGPTLLYWSPLSAIADIDNPNYANFYYLGTTIRAPEISFDNPQEKVMNSIGGTMVPTDASWQGSSATIVLPMNRYSESSVRAIQSLPYFNGPGSSLPAATTQDAGMWSFQDIGALSQQDSASFMLLMMNAYGPNPGVVANLPLGRRFLCCTWPEGKETDSTTVPKIETMVFQANMYRGAFNTSQGFVNSTYRIFDFNVPAQTALPLPS